MNRLAVPTTNTIDAFCAPIDDLFYRRSARQAFRHYLIGLLLSDVPLRLIN